MLTRIVRYFKGYLRIRVYGNNIERFLNICSNKKVFLWNITPCQKAYELNIFLRDFKKAKPIFSKTKTRVTIVERFGYPFFVSKYKHRKPFFIGVILCFAIIYLFSTYIWNIKLSGNQTYTDENISKYLKEIHIEQGIKRSEVDCMKIASEIRKHFEDIIWVSVSVEGSNLYIQVKENEDENMITNNTSSESDAAYDLVAAYDCTITDMIIRNGIAKVEVGDSVKKGDLLVSGQIPIYNDASEIIRYKYCVSDADIYGNTVFTYENILSANYNQKEYINIEKHQYYCTIAGYRLFLGDIKNNYEHSKMESSQVNLGNFCLGIRSVYPYHPQKATYTKSEMQQILSSDFHYYCSQLEKKGVVILQNDVKIYTWSDKAKAMGTLSVKMPIGQKQKSTLNKIGDNIDGNDGNNN